MENLVLQAAAGDDAAFTELMNIHKVQLYKIAFSYLRSEDEAVEALQEVTFRAYRAVRKLKDPAYFSTWLVRIMLNYCHDRRKKQRRIILDETMAAQAAVYPNDAGFEVKQALADMEAGQRELLELKYFQDLKIKEIAALLACPESTVKTRLYKALGTLRDKLDLKGDAPHV